VLCDNVKVPWEKVFVTMSATVSDIYIKTPEHCFGNHQSNVRTGRRCAAARPLQKIAQATGADRFAVRETWARLGGVESRSAAGAGQITPAKLGGGMLLQPPIMYAGSMVQGITAPLTNCATLGGGVFACRRHFGHGRPESPRSFRPSADAAGDAVPHECSSRWDMVGTEIRRPALQYEKFYAGVLISASFLQRDDWGEFNKLVED